MLTLPHPDTMRDLITEVAWGAAAAAHEGNGLLIALPHAVQISKYAAAYVHWSPGIVVSPGTEVTWHYVERKQKTSGTFIVHDVDDIEGDYPAGAEAPVAATRGRLIATGKTSQFTLVQALEKHVTRLLEASNRLVAREIEGRIGDEAETWAPTLNHGVADEVALESLSTELLWGTPEQPDSTVLRMVERAATTSINNQPLGSWFDRNLSARCEEAIRRYIDDPHIGRKIRRLQREHQPATVDELIELYRRVNPKESVGRERVFKALSADKTLNAVSHSLSLVVNVREGDESADVEVSDEEQAAE